MKLLFKFYDNQWSNHNEIVNAARSFDIETGHRLAHTEKNAALLIGAAKLSELLNEIEKEFAKGFTEYPKDLMESYKAELERVLDYIAGLKHSD